jgi:hypothetical protein
MTVFLLRFWSPPRSVCRKIRHRERSTLLRSSRKFGLPSASKDGFLSRSGVLALPRVRTGEQPVRCAKRHCRGQSAFACSDAALAGREYPAAIVDCACGPDRPKRRMHCEWTTNTLDRDTTYVAPFMWTSIAEGMGPPDNLAHSTLSGK